MTGLTFDLGPRLISSYKGPYLKVASCRPFQSLSKIANWEENRTYKDNWNENELKDK